MRDLDIAIVGGGIAGLALAAGLANRPHLKAHVYEPVAQYLDVGAGLALHQNAIKAMELIGPKVRQAYFDKARSMGEEDQEMTTEAKRRGESLSRADLLDGFRALISSSRISFGKRLVDIAESQTAEGHQVQLTFEDGTSISVDCLLGVDGIHSTTRAYLLGRDHLSAAPKNHDGWQIYQTMGHINCIPLNGNTRLSVGVAVRGAKFTSDGQASALDPTLYSDYSEEAQQIVRMVAKDTSASCTAADHDHAPFYARNNVAIFGDAAHALLPFAGNGAAQALEDAAVLNFLFTFTREPWEIALALQEFDKVRRPRSQAVVDLARKFGRVYAFAEDGMHEDPARMREFFAEMAAFTNDFNVKGQNSKAMRRISGRDEIYDMI